MYICIMYHHNFDKFERKSHGSKFKVSNFKDGKILIFSQVTEVKLKFTLVKAQVKSKVRMQRKNQFSTLYKRKLSKVKVMVQGHRVSVIVISLILLQDWQLEELVLD